MATTNNFSLPYPQGNDPYNIPEDIENLAKSIDSSLKAVSDSVATLDYSTTETVEEVKKNLEILEQEINRAGLPNIEQIMVDIEEARKELEAAKEEFSVGQAELGVHLTNLRDERMPALEKSVQEAQAEMDTAMDEFMARQSQFEDSISDAEEDIAEAKRRAEALENELDKAGGIKERLETALEGEVDHDRLRVGTGGFDEVFAREVVAGIIGAEKAEVIDLIAEDLIANNATIINAALQNLTVTERANFVTAFADELYADEFTARVARMARATVASQNLIPGMSRIHEATPPPFKSGFGRNTGHPSIWVRSGDSEHGDNTVTTSGDADALIHLEASEVYRFRVGVSSSKSGTTAYMALADENGNRVNVTRNGSNSSYLLVNHEAGSTATQPEYYEAEISPPYSGAFRLIFYANHTNGAPNPGSYQWFHGLTIANILDGQLIATNSVKTPQLDVDQIFGNTAVLNKLFADLITARFLNAQEALIGGALIKNNEITVDKLTALDTILAEMLKVRKIEAGDIAADAITADKIAGGAIDGKTITGATVRTASTGNRLEMRGNSITGYNSNNTVASRFTPTGISLTDGAGQLQDLGNHIYGSVYVNSWIGSKGASTPTGSATSYGPFYLPNNTATFTVSSRQYRCDVSFNIFAHGMTVGSDGWVLFEAKPKDSNNNSLSGAFFSREVYVGAPMFDVSLNYSMSEIRSLPSSVKLGETAIVGWRMRNRGLEMCRVSNVTITLTPV